MANAKYTVQPQQQSAVRTRKGASRLQAYAIVIGLSLGCFLGATGAAMGLFAYFYKPDGHISMADEAGFPTKAVSITFVVVGTAFIAVAFTLCACFGFSDSASVDPYKS